MIIHVDADLNSDGSVIAYHVLDTSLGASVLVLESANPLQPMTVVDYISWLNVNKPLFAKHGYDKISKLPGLPANTTRWQAVVNQVKASTDPQLQAIAGALLP